MKKLLLTLTLFMLSLNFLSALEWEYMERSFKASPQDTEIHTTYPFKNASDKTVKIWGVKTSCGCTAGKLDKKSYEPGETGEIKVTFKIGAKVGKKTQTITVSTDDKENHTVKLSLTVDIPTLLKFTPRMLFWKKGESREAKELQIEVLEKDLIKELITAYVPKDFDVKLLKDKEGFFKLQVKPLVDDKPAKGNIRLNADYPKDKPKSFNIYLSAR